MTFFADLQIMQICKCADFLGEAAHFLNLQKEAANRFGFRLHLILFRRNCTIRKSRKQPHLPQNINAI